MDSDWALRGLSEPLFDNFGSFWRSCLSLLPSSYFLVPTSEFLLPTSDFRVPTSCVLLPTTDCLLPTSYFRVPTSEFLLPSSYFLLPTSEFLLPSPYSISSYAYFSRPGLVPCTLFWRAWSTRGLPHFTLLSYICSSRGRLGTQRPLGTTF